MKIFTRFDNPPSAGLACGEGLTQQHFKEECDINNILRNYVPSNNVPPPVFADFSVTELSSAYDIVRSASVQFDALDANIRARFNHSPLELMNFLANDKNREEAYQLGLLVRPPQPPQSSPQPPQSSPQSNPQHVDNSDVPPSND